MAIEDYNCFWRFPRENRSCIQKYRQLVRQTTSWLHVLLKHLNPPSLQCHLLRTLQHQTLRMKDRLACCSVQKKKQDREMSSSVCGWLVISELIFLHAVQANWPSNVTGRVGAVGQIHFTWMNRWTYVVTSGKLSNISLLGWFMMIGLLVVQ